jgi:rhamnulokinase
MREALKAYCRRTEQPEPQSVGEVVRCCLDSLALRYRWVMQTLEDLGGHTLKVIRIVGGGSQNRLLCQLTADATGRRVAAGPVEATALGNIMVQAVATGHLQDLDAGRKAIEASTHLETFDPQPIADWDSAFLRFQSLLPTAG